MQSLEINHKSNETQSFSAQFTWNLYMAMEFLSVFPGGSHWLVAVIHGCFVTTHFDQDISVAETEDILVLPPTNSSGGGDGDGGGVSLASAKQDETQKQPQKQPQKQTRKVSMTLIARRSRYQAGPRFVRRVNTAVAS